MPRLPEGLGQTGRGQTASFRASGGGSRADNKRRPGLRMDMLGSRAGAAVAGVRARSRRVIVPPTHARPCHRCRSRCRRGPCFRRGLLLRSPAPEPTAARPGPAAPAPAPPAPAPVTSTPSAEPVAPPRRMAAPPPPAPPVDASPTTVTLRVEVDVPGASVLIDRVGVGTAPLTIPNLAPGPHRINVVASGYDSYSEDIDLAPGTRTLTVSFKEIKLDARLAAVHKHGIGSCRGDLVATPTGLRYEAADGKDTMAVALTDLATFEVDYLEKNLRVRTRQGRTFNFTDPDGNADRLYLFHQQVDKVRKRLQTQ